jgi:hypothetical protein
MRRARWLIVLLLACEESSASDDPIATTGAEVHVTVVGPGRVVSDVPGIDCPGESCFANLVALRNGSTRSVTLNAVADERSHFDGWTFDTWSPLGAPSRGPDTCSPVLRAGVQPAVDPHATQIVLPYGDVVGFPPSGTELTCASYRNVPVAYVATAKFHDVAKDDAELVYLPTIDGTGPAREIAVIGDNLVWRYETRETSLESLAIGSTTTLLLPGTPEVAVSQVSFGALAFSRGLPQAIPPGSALFQRQDTGLLLWVLQPQVALLRVPRGGQCIALAADPFDSGLAFCRTDAGQIQRLDTRPEGDAPVEIASNVAPGKGLAVANASVFVPEATSILRFLEFPEDDTHPVEALTDLVDPSGIVVSTSFGRIWFIDHDSSGAGIVTQFPVFDLAHPVRVTPPISGITIIAPDEVNSAEVWAAVTGAEGKILHVRTGSDPVTCRTGIRGLGGLAVNAQYVYWTQADGGVYRQRRGSCLFK